jgi:hypothetical protein
VYASLVTPQPLDLIVALRFFMRLELLENLFKLLGVHFKEAFGLLGLILLLELDQGRYGCQILFL